MRAKGEPKTVLEEFNRLISLSTNIGVGKDGRNVGPATKSLSLDASDDIMIDPWESADLSWSDEIKLIKKEALVCLIKDIEPKYTRDTVKAVFKTIRLHGKNIQIMDSSLKAFKKLEYLSLNGNLIKECSELPTSLKFLALNANMYVLLKQVYTMPSLILFGQFGACRSVSQQHIVNWT
jgi:Leucine-rich repeat (LRR) protein